MKEVPFLFVDLVIQPVDVLDVRAKPDSSAEVRCGVDS